MGSTVSDTRGRFEVIETEVVGQPPREQETQELQEQQAPPQQHKASLRVRVTSARGACGYRCTCSNSRGELRSEVAVLQGCLGKRENM